MKITEEQTAQSPLSFALSSVDPDENETGIEDEDDLHEVRVGDDVREPDAEKDYLADEPEEESEPVPSPS